jgi:hypothetical protein
MGCLQGFQGIVRGILVAVEKMFGVVDHFAAAGFEKITLSAIMARFSSRVLSMIFSTCRASFCRKWPPSGHRFS